MLRPIARDLWVAEQPLRFYGVPVGARMSVVRLSSGGVLLYSPIDPTPELRAAVEAIGPVRFRVAPNRWHHLFAAEWGDGELWIAPGLARKRPDLAIGARLSDGAGGWAADLEHHAMAGAPLFGETVFLHRASRSLLCCDLVHNVTARSPVLQRVFMRALGGYGGVKTNLSDRVAARDRKAHRQSLERVLGWDFDRIVMAHGEICETGGLEALRRAYSWALL
jgi:hypothetical protein